jgi:hypothetical protein
VLRTGKRPVPAELIEAARQAKAELSKVLTSADDVQTQESEHLRCAEAEKPGISAASIEDAHVSAFDNPQEFCGSRPGPASKALTSPSLSAFGENERLQRRWGEAEQERAAIVEYDGGIPRAWAEGFARLHPDRPPGDVPVKRWHTFVDDIGRFLDSPFCAVATALGWGPLDLFSCDRDRPFARVNCVGLLWRLNGDKLIALSENTATIEKPTRARQIYRRKPAEAGRVLAWELAP